MGDVLLKFLRSYLSDQVKQYSVGERAFREPASVILVRSVTFTLYIFLLGVPVLGNGIYI